MQNIPSIAVLRLRFEEQLLILEGIPLLVFRTGTHFWDHRRKRKKNLLYSSHFKADYYIQAIFTGFLDMEVMNWSIGFHLSFAGFFSDFSQGVRRFYK